MYQKIKNKFYKIKDDLLKYRSPLRWSFLGLLLALSLFCCEIALSCYSLYLSLVGGDVVVGITWLDSFFFVLFIIFAAASVGGVALMFFIIIMWWKDRDTGKEDIIIQDMPRVLDELKQNIIDEIEKKLRGKQDEQG